MQSKELHYSRYFNYLTAPDLIPLGLLPPIRQYWITHILDLIPCSYPNLSGQRTEEIIDDVLNEINDEYYYAGKKAILDYILKNEEERDRIGVGIVFDKGEEWGEGKYHGVEIDEEWREEVSRGRNELGKKCVSYCQGTLSIKKVWSVIGDDSFFELGCVEKQKFFELNPRKYYIVGNSQERALKEEQWTFEGKWGKYGQGGTLNEFIKDQNEKIELIKTKIKENWIPDVARIYQKDLDDMNKEEIIIFFRASTGLMSCQIRELIYKSLNQLKYFFRQFSRQSYLSPTACLENDLDPEKML
jgi:dynein heavy chain, axonemal